MFPISPDIEEPVYDVIRMDTPIKATTAVNPTLFSPVSTDTAADYEEPITLLKVTGNRRLQMDSVNPVSLEIYRSTEDDTLNDQAKNDS